MAVSRDTSADDAAALHRRAIEGESDPPVTLSGTAAASLRTRLRDLYAMLERLEARTKAWSERARIREARGELGVAIALIPPVPGTPTPET
jgi:hypothetical protein